MKHRLNTDKNCETKPCARRASSEFHVKVQRYEMYHETPIPVPYRCLIRVSSVAPYKGKALGWRLHFAPHSFTTLGHAIHRDGHRKTATASETARVSGRHGTAYSPGGPPILIAQARRAHRAGGSGKNQKDGRGIEYLPRGRPHPRSGEQRGPGKFCPALRINPALQGHSTRGSARSHA